MNDERFSKDFRFVRTADIQNPEIAELGTHSADSTSRVLNAYEGCARKLDGDVNLSPNGALAAKVELVTAVHTGFIQEQSEKLENEIERTNIGWIVLRPGPGFNTLAGRLHVSG